MEIEIGLTSGKTLRFGVEEDQLEKAITDWTENTMEKFADTYIAVDKIEYIKGV